MSKFELEAVDGSTELQIRRDPKKVLEEAQQAAALLKDIVDKKPHPVIFNDERYLEFEDWQTVAKFYGVVAKIEETRFIDLGGAQGYEATAVAIHVPSGQIISQADSMCLNDEEKWSARPKYEWQYVCRDGTVQAEDPGRDQIVWEEDPKRAGKKRPKKKRVHVGEVAVPMFQLRSMAQTRAGAKVLRQIFAWVVVLAGYRPTPAEDLTGDEDFERGDTGQARGSAGAGRDPEPVRKITEGQAKRLYAIAMSHNWSKEKYRGWVKKWGASSDRDLTTAVYDRMLTLVQANQDSGPEDPGGTAPAEAPSGGTPAAGAEPPLTDADAR